MQSCTTFFKVGYSGNSRHTANPSDRERTGVRYAVISFSPIRLPQSKNASGAAMSSPSAATNAKIKIVFICFTLPPPPFSYSVFPLSLQQQHRTRNDQCEQHACRRHLIHRQIDKPVVKQMLKQIDVFLRIISGNQIRFPEYLEGI